MLNSAHPAMVERKNFYLFNKKDLILLPSVFIPKKGATKIISSHLYAFFSISGIVIFTLHVLELIKTLFSANIVKKL